MKRSICILIIVAAAVAGRGDARAANDEPWVVKAIAADAVEDPVPGVLGVPVDGVTFECPAGFPVPCGTNHCIPAGTVCCASVGHEEGYCQAGQTCTADGGCITGGGGGGGGECGSNMALTQASCGGDTCSCALACNSSSDCATGCCSGGFCALSCVCAGQGGVDYSCGDGGGFGGGGGCSAAPGSSGASDGDDPGLAIALMSALVGLLVVARRRRRGAIVRGAALTALVVLATVASVRTASAQGAPGCTMDSQCKGDRVCDEGVCRAPALASCAADSDCPGAEVCETGVCRASGEARVSAAPPPPPTTIVVATAPASPPPTTTTPPPPTVTAASTVQPTTPPDRALHRHGFAGDWAATLGVASADGDSVLYAGSRSGLGGYAGENLALLFTASYDRVYVDDLTRLWLGSLGAAVRFSARESNNSLRLGIGLAMIGDDFGSTSGLALDGDLFVLGRGKAGLSIHTGISVFDGFNLLRLGVGGVLFD